MNVARRLYVYGLLAVSLAILTFGMARLFELAFEVVAGRFAGDVLATSEVDAQRQALSQALALIVVSGPVWLLHWWLAQRRALDDREERGSAIRLFYLAGALGGALLVWFGPAVESIEALLRWLLNAPEGDYYPGSDPEGWLAALLALSLVWLLHAFLLRVDMRLLPGVHPAGWPFRLYFYGAAALGLVLLLGGAVQFARLFTDLVFAGDALKPEGDVWRRGLASALAAVAVGMLIWAGHWLYAQRRVRGPVPAATVERDATIRRVYLYGALLVGALAALLGVSGSLQEPLRLLLDVSEADDTRDSLGLIAGPLLRAAPFAALWLAHRATLGREASEQAETDARAGLERLYLYLLAFAGLAAGGTALAYLLGILIDLAFDGGRTLGVSDDWWREQIARFAPLALVGALLWLWHWNRVAFRVRRDPFDERRALTRRIYVYAVLGVALVAAIVSLGVIVYQAFEALFGVTAGDGFIEDTSAAFGVLLVGAALVAYHAAILRADLEAEEQAEAAEIRRPLLLIAPPGSDPDPVVDRLRASLPDDFRLEER